MRKSNQSGWTLPHLVYTASRAKGRLRSLCAAFCFVACAFTPASARPVYPKDEAKEDRSFLEFRSQLLNAVDKRDGRFILSVLSPRVLTALGGGVGKANFEHDWDLKSKQSPFWPKFKFALTHGGYFEAGKKEKKFTAPYATFFFADEDGTDTEDERAVVMEKSVPLRSAANDAAASVITLNYDLVKIADDDADTEKRWLKIKTLDGKKVGYVPSSVLIRQTSPYAEFEQQHGRWQLLWFGTASP